MMRFDANRVRRNACEAETEDLLDRVTIYREGMEPEALELIEGELRARGITVAQIETHARQREGQVMRREYGTAAVCTYCRQPAVAEGWGWHRLGGLVPVFPRRLRYCEGHRPAVLQPPTPESSGD